MKLKPLLLLSLLFALASSRAIAQVGVPYAWGQNSWGQLGDGTPIDRATPVKLLKTGIVQVATGFYYSLALKSNGAVWQWGDYKFGHVGDGYYTKSGTKPMLVPNLTEIVQVAAGGEHSLALKSDGTVWAWGLNYGGQLGDGTFYGTSYPKQVSGLTSIVQIGAFEAHSLALRSDGTVWAWGFNYSGQIGDGTSGTDANGFIICRTLPVQVSGLNSIVQIGGERQSSIALKADGTVWAWGNNGAGGLGDGTNVSHNTPIQVIGLTNIVQITSGLGMHSFALQSDGSVWGWGWNAYGQLGDGTTTTRNTPVQVATLKNVAQIVAGAGHSLALMPDGKVWAWGGNLHGALGDGTGGDGTTSHDRHTPILIPTLTGITQIAASGHSLAVTNGAQKAIAKIPSLIITYEQPITLVASLKLASWGFPLANRPVTFSIDGNVVGTRYTNCTGATNFTVPNYLSLGVGKHTITAASSQDVLYASNMATATLTIKKISTSLSMGSVSGRPGDTRTIKATLKRKSDGTPLSGITLAFKVDGTTFGTATTDSSGVVAVTFKVDEIYSVGAHTLTIDYAGDANQSASTAKATYTVKQAPGGILGSSVSGKAGATVTLKAKLIRKTDSALLVGRTVRFQIDNVDVGTAVTDGINLTMLAYTIPSSLAVGTHTLSSIFDGDAFYTSSISNKSLVVKP